jgi:hypothetical protein
MHGVWDDASVGPRISSIRLRTYLATQIAILPLPKSDHEVKKSYFVSISSGRSTEVLSAIR